MRYLLIVLIMLNFTFGKEKITYSNVIEYSKTAKSLYQVYLFSQNKDKLENAYEIMDELFNRFNNNIGILKLYYEITSEYLRVFHNKKALNNFIKATQELKKNGIKTEPINFYKSLFAKDKNEKEHLLKSAIKEDKQFIYAYYELATIYEEQNQTKASYDILNNALKNAKEEEKPIVKVAMVYFMDMYAHELYDATKDYNCTNVDKFNKKFYNYANEAYTITGDNKYLIPLIDATQLLGEFDKAYNYAKEAYEKGAIEVDMYKYYLLSFLHIKEYEKISNKDNISSKVDYMYYYLKQDWDNAYKYIKESIKKEDNKDFYNYLKWTYISMLKYKNMDDANKILNSIDKKLITKWTQTLKDYLQGKISKDSLLKTASSKCKQSEAYFAIAIKKLSQNSKSEAIKYFKKVVELKIYPYVEYSFSKYYLQNANWISEE